MLARVLTLLSTVAVALAAVGLYAGVAFSVAERTREFGVWITSADFQLRFTW